MIDPDQAPAAARLTRAVNDILPTVDSAPGFVAGYWLASEPQTAERWGEAVGGVRV
jgi:hypothetical protein